MRYCHLADAMMDDLINLGSEKSGCLILKSWSASWPRVFIPSLFLFLHVASASLSTTRQLFDHIGSNYCNGAKIFFSIY